MKIRFCCWLGLLMIIGSMATAQAVPPPSLPCSPSPIKAVVNWAEFGFAPCRTGFNPYELVLSPTTVANLSLHWRYTTGYFFESSPAVANGVLYVGCYDSRVYALNASTGAHVWQYRTGEVVTSSPAVANGVVYFGSWDNSVYALTASEGRLLWKYTTGSAVFSSPAVANGVVYVGSDDNSVYALDAGTGTLAVEVHHRECCLFFAGGGQRRGVHRVR